MQSSALQQQDIHSLRIVSLRDGTTVTKMLPAKPSALVVLALPGFVDDGQLRLMYCTAGTQLEVLQGEEVVYAADWSSLLRELGTAITAMGTSECGNGHVFYGTSKGTVGAMRFEMSGPAEMQFVPTTEQKLHALHVAKVSVSADGCLVAAASADATVTVTPATALLSLGAPSDHHCESSWVLRGHLLPVTDVVFATHSDFVVSCSLDSTCRVFELQGQQGWSLLHEVVFPVRLTCVAVARGAHFGVAFVGGQESFVGAVDFAASVRSKIAKWGGDAVRGCTNSGFSSGAAKGLPAAVIPTSREGDFCEQVNASCAIHVQPLADGSKGAHMISGDGSEYKAVWSMDGCCIIQQQLCGATAKNGSLTVAARHLCSAAPTHETLSLKIADRRHSDVLLQSLEPSDHIHRQPASHREELLLQRKQLHATITELRERLRLKGVAKAQRKKSRKSAVK